MNAKRIEQSAAFYEFVWRYINVCAKAQMALGRKVDYEQIKDYGQDIEPLVRDYMTLMANNADPTGDWKKEVKMILAAFSDSDCKDYRVPREMMSRDHSVVALLRYCKDKELYDSVAASLATTYEYERVYFDKLMSSLLPLMEKLTTGQCAGFIDQGYIAQ